MYDATVTNNINSSAFAYGSNSDPEFTVWNATGQSLANATTSIAQFIQAGP